MNPYAWAVLALAVAFLGAAISAHRRRRTAESGLLNLADELKTARQELLASREQAAAERQTLFNSMIEGVMVLDAKGCIVLVNRSFEEQFDVRLDLRGMPASSAVGHPRLAALLSQVANASRPAELELELNTPIPRLLDVTAAPILDRDAHPAGTVLVFHDLTRTRELENTRREFVANVSHELRTPLSLIQGYVETLRSGVTDPATIQRFLGIIDRHTQRLTKLIEDILTISRIESGAIRLDLRPVDLASLTREVLSHLEPQAAARQTRLLSEVPDGFVVEADRDRLEQVLVNLVENAIKYGRQGGSVRVSARTRDDQRVEWSVTDDGPGIPQEIGDRVFERFYRVDKARSRETGGTGLGLAIVKHIVQSHGGEVGLDSRSGAGCRFWVCFPPIGSAVSSAEG